MIQHSGWYRTQILRAKFNSAYDSVSKPGRPQTCGSNIALPLLLTSLAAALCLFGEVPVASAGLQQFAADAHEGRHPNGKCPSPSELDTRLSEASSLIANGHYQEAASALKPYAGLRCDPRASLLLSAALEGTGYVTEAEAVLERAHLDWPADDRIATSLARDYLAQHQNIQAAKALEHFKATTETPSQQIELAVVVSMASHQLTSAASLARLNYQAHPSLHSLLLLANALQLEGRYKEVIALLGIKRHDYASSAPFLVTLAQSEYDAAMYDVARSDVQQAISYETSLYAAHYVLGNILLKLGDPEPAEAEYRTAIALEPDQPRTYYYLALALRAQHREAEEEGYLTKAIALNSQYALAHCEMGRILLNQNRLSEAVSQLSQAVEDNAASEQAYYLLSRAYDRLGDYRKAEAMAQQLVIVRKKNHQASSSQGDLKPAPEQIVNP